MLSSQCICGVTTWHHACIVSSHYDCARENHDSKKGWRNDVVELVDLSFLLAVELSIKYIKLEPSQMFNQRKKGMELASTMKVSWQIANLTRSRDADQAWWLNCRWANRVLKPDKRRTLIIWNVTYKTSLNVNQKLWEPE